jgi:hypothetical protein
MKAASNCLFGLKDEAVRMFGPEVASILLKEPLIVPTTNPQSQPQQPQQPPHNTGQQLRMRNMGPFSKIQQLCQSYREKLHPMMKYGNEEPTRKRPASAAGLENARPMAPAQRQSELHHASRGAEANKYRKSATASSTPQNHPHRQPVSSLPPMGQCIKRMDGA